MNTYHAELKHPQGAHYSLTAPTSFELVQKMNRRMERRGNNVRDFNAVSTLADEPDYLSWPNGWTAKVWKD
jgi:hypothetical protein